MSPTQTLRRPLLNLKRSLGRAGVLALLSPLGALGGCSDSEAPTLEEQRRVGINTIRDPSLKSDETCGPYPNYYLEYLDDTRCRKRLPSDRDREFTCPIKHSAESLVSAPGYAPLDPDAQVTVDERALVGLVPDEAAITMILIRRVDDVPHYRYLSNGRHDTILETWSSSKFLGVMNASEGLRYSSGGKLGLDGSIGDTPLGDLVTIVHNYDERTYTSNGLMYWFHDIGGRVFANEMIHKRWLNRPAGEEYGANYGANPPKLGFTFTKGEGEDKLEVEVKPHEDWRPSNKLSTFTLAEALKRLVMYREDPAGRLEYSTWDDVKVLLYGASESQMYDEATPQGMEGDISVYMQEAVNINALDELSRGQWRIFSKLGLGFSRGGEIVHTDYACLPVFDEGGEPQVDQGVEVVISIHLPAYEKYAQRDRELAEIYRTLIQGVLSGDIK